MRTRYAGFLVVALAAAVAGCGALPSLPAGLGASGEPPARACPMLAPRTQCDIAGANAPPGAPGSRHTAREVRDWYKGRLSACRAEVAAWRRSHYYWWQCGEE